MTSWKVRRQAKFCCHPECTSARHLTTFLSQTCDLVPGSRAGFKEACWVAALSFVAQEEIHCLYSTSTRLLMISMYTRTHHFIKYFLQLKWYNTLICMEGTTIGMWHFPFLLFYCINFVCAFIHICMQTCMLLWKQTLILLEDYSCF